MSMNTGPEMPAPPTWRAAVLVDQRRGGTSAMAARARPSKRGSAGNDGTSAGWSMPDRMTLTLSG